MKTTKTFSAIRKPIYIAEVTASGSDFPFTADLFKKFVEKHPEYKGCQYDSKYINGTWTIKLYRECAIDFVN